MSTHAEPAPDLVPEEELHDLFAPRRPDPDSFREGIDRRIREREEEEPVESRFWRRVAGFMPIDPVILGLAGGGAAKGFGGKVFTAALALPILILVTTVGGFFASVRSLRRSVADAAEQSSLARQQEIGAVAGNADRGGFAPGPSPVFGFAPGHGGTHHHEEPPTGEGNHVRLQ